MNKDVLPPAFVQRMHHTLGNVEFNAFELSLDQPPPVSIHFHNSKPSHFKKIKGSLEPVPWSSHGFYLPERPLFTVDPGFQSGGYYVQEASSMLVDDEAVNSITFATALDMRSGPFSGSGENGCDRTHLYIFQGNLNQAVEAGINDHGIAAAAR